MGDIQDINDDLKAWHQRVIERIDLIHEHADKKMDIGKGVTFKLKTPEEIKAFRLGVQLAKSMLLTPPQFTDEWEVRNETFI